MYNYAEIFLQTWALALTVIFFGGSIFVHELGHFLAARWRKLKVEKFSVGFGPKIFGWTGRDGCEYKICLLPFGGYVALPQLADMGLIEGGDSKEESPQSHPPISYFDKVSVSAAGAVFNIIFAALIACVVWFVGVPVNAVYKTTVAGAVPEFIYNIDGAKLENPARLAGLMPGDKILKVDGRELREFVNIIEYVAIGSGRAQDGAPQSVFTVERDGKIFDILIKPALIQTNASTGDPMRMVSVLPAMPLKVDQVLPGYPAQKAGLMTGDIVESLDGIKLYSNAQVPEYLDKLKDGAKVTLGVLRDGKNITLEAYPKRDTVSKPLCRIAFEKGGAYIDFFTRTFGNAFAEKISADAEGSVQIYKVSSSDPRLSGLNAGDAVYNVAGKDIKTLMQLDTLVKRELAHGSCVLNISDAAGSLKSVVLPKGASSSIIPPQTVMRLGYIVDGETLTSHPDVISQFRDAITRTYDALSSLINPKSDIGINQLAGPVDIVRLMHKLSMLNISLILSFVVLLNINLAILNLLPIPVLDGGHILFATIAKIMRKPIPQGVIASVQGFFMILFMGFMIYIVYYGLLRWDGDNRFSDRMDIEKSFYVSDKISTDDKDE